jgi:AcrR family transcriptional regulator
MLLASVRHRTGYLRLILEVKAAGEPISGWVATREDDRRPFIGWLQLVSEVETARRKAPTTSLAELAMAREPSSPHDGATGRAGDGRAARSERTREALLDALLDLIDEGGLRPPVELIAVRAKVCPRSLYGHFGSVETLFAATLERQWARAFELAPPLSYAAPLQHRLLTRQPTSEHLGEPAADPAGNEGPGTALRHHQRLNGRHPCSDNSGGRPSRRRRTAGARGRQARRFARRDHNRCGLADLGKPPRVSGTDGGRSARGSATDAHRAAELATQDA